MIASIFFTPEGYNFSMGKATVSEILPRALAFSEYLADRRAADPEAFEALTDEALECPTRAEYDAALAAALQGPAFADPAALGTVVHRHFVRILLAERAGRPFPEVLRALSDLADAVLSRLVGDLLAEDVEKHGETEAGFCVLALGKLGGRELNFSSDVDLIFLYGSEGEDGGFDRAARFTRLAERLIEVLESPRPLIYRVDARLRPEGAAGPLVRSLESAVRYYERAGAAWERQALIKCRAVAGDLEVGRAFLRGVEPFVWRTTLDRETVFEIEQVQARILSEGGGAENVKLGPGGIREIEFTTQILQLLNGGRQVAVRAPGTREALAALEAHRYLLPEHRAAAERCYLYLRRLEHLLQARAFRQTHRLPRGEALDALALAMGEADGGALRASYDAVREEVRRLSEFHFRRGRQVSVTETERLLLAVLDEALEEEKREAAARRLGFSDGARARSELVRMARGTTRDVRTSTVRRLFVRAADVLLPRLAAAAGGPGAAAGGPGAAGAADEALTRLARLFDRYGAKASIYETLAAHPEVADLVVSVAGESALFAERLAADPGSLEALLAPATLLAPYDAAEARKRLAEYRALGLDAESLVWEEARLHLGARFLTGRADAEETAAGLAEAASVALEGALPESVGLVAFGGLGRGRLGFLSDLDVAFFALPGVPLGTATEEVQAFLRGREGKALRFDPRLRPMGRDAPLVQTPAEVARYLREDAEPWERVVWSSARLLTPNDEIEAARREFLARVLEGAAREAFWSVLDRAQAEGAPGDPKKAPGGFLEVDFRLAALSDPNDPRRDLLEEARRALSAWARAHEVVFGAPWKRPLSNDLRDRLAAILERGGAPPRAPEEIFQEVREIRSEP